MKGFLTFTIAAGVAITTTSVAQAGGMGQRQGVASKPAAVAQAPMGVGAMGLTLDRGALTREIERLAPMLNSIDPTDDSGSETAVPSEIKSGGIWLF